jgi:hypothetical protein
VPDKVTISHRGERYEIGLGKRQYAVWAVSAPRDEPVDRWPETSQGWSQAWARFTAIETPGTIAAVPRARALKIPGILRRNATGATSVVRLPVVAAALLGAGVILGIAGLFPDYFTGQSLTAATEQLVPHVLYLATWAAAAALILARGPGSRAGGLPRAGALLGTGLCAVTFGLLVANLGTGTAGHAGAGAGMILTIISWVACAAGSAAGLRIRPDGQAALPGATAAGAAGSKPGRADTGAIALLALCALGAAITFIPSWDSYTLTQAPGNTSQTVTAGNVFDNHNPGWVIFGDVAAVVALVVVAVAAAAWRPARHGAALLAGAIVAMAAQAISALIQVSEPASPQIFGISAAQARANGLSISSGATSIFWVYVLFVIALVISCAWLLTTPTQHGPTQRTAPAHPPVTTHPEVPERPAAPTHLTVPAHPGAPAHQAAGNAAGFYPAAGPANLAESPASVTGADQAQDRPAATPESLPEGKEGNEGTSDHGSAAAPLWGATAVKYPKHSESPPASDAWGRFRSEVLLPLKLLTGRRLVLRNEVGRDPAAVLDVISVLARPVADLGGVECPVSRLSGPTCGATSPAGGAADLARVGHVLAERRAQLVGVLGAEVDLVFSPVQRKAHRALGLAAVDVVNEEGLDLLSHLITAFPRFDSHHIRRLRVRGVIPGSTPRAVRQLCGLRPAHRYLC